jgi:hypothetical protein
MDIIQQLNLSFAIRAQVCPLSSDLNIPSPAARTVLSRTTIAETEDKGSEEGRNDVHDFPEFIVEANPLVPPA